jgi:hypothetical protein
MRRYWSALRHSLALAIGAATVAAMAVPGAAFAIQVPLAHEYAVHHSGPSAGSTSVGSTSISTLGVVLVVGLVTAIVLVAFAGLRRAARLHATVVRPRLSGTES